MFRSFDPKWQTGPPNKPSGDSTATQRGLSPPALSPPAGREHGGAMAPSAREREEQGAPSSGSQPIPERLSVFASLQLPG